MCIFFEQPSDARSPSHHSWSPLLTLQHCIVHTEAKLIIVDSARADVLEPVAPTLLAEAGASAILVIEPQEGKGVWQSMTSWGDALAAYKGDPRSVLSRDPAIVAEDDATILFTSGASSLAQLVVVWISHRSNRHHGYAQGRSEHSATVPDQHPQCASSSLLCHHRCPLSILS